MTAHKHPLPAASDALRSGTTGPALRSPAGAGPNPSMPCRECNGEGEAEYMGLLDSYYRWADCHRCHGSGVEAPYCSTCGEKLTVDGWCYPCDDREEGFVFIERISPTRIAL